MDAISTVLWPRHEVLQLVLPDAVCPGGGLSSSSASEAIRQLSLSKITHLDDDSGGLVSFNHWLDVARKTLAWNDYSAMLFWDLLNIAISYLSKVSCDYINSSNYGSVEFEYIAIFLAMYISEPNMKSQSPNSSQSPYVETMWPSQAVELDQFVASSPASPRNSGNGGLSGSSRRSSDRLSNSSSAGSPKSPHSPSRSTNNAALSWKSSWTHSRTANYLQAVRSKIPIILSALSVEDNFTEDTASTASTSTSFSNVTNLTLKTDFLVTSRTIDCLRLIIGGGSDWESEVHNISALHPSLKPGLSNPALHRNTFSEQSSSAVPLTYISFNDISNWLNLHMAINEHFYPKPGIAAASPLSPTGISGGSISPNSKTGGNSHLFGGVEARANKDEIAEGDFLTNHLTRSTPSQTVHSLMAFGRLNPTVFSNTTNSTHIVFASAVSSGSIDNSNSTASTTDNAGLPNDNDNHQFDITSRIERLEVSSRNDAGANELYELDNFKISQLGSGVFSNAMRQSIDSSFNSDAGVGESFNHDMVSDPSNQSTRSSNKFADISRLPVGLISDCSNATLYLLCPYSSVYITNCQDLTVIIGAVGGAVICNGCQRVKISVVCRKLILQDCQDCVINLASVSTSMLTSDCQGIVFGPFNVAYRHMKAHITLVGLGILCRSSRPAASTAVDSSTEGHVSSSEYNVWNSFCDIMSTLREHATERHLLGDNFLRSDISSSPTLFRTIARKYPTPANESLANVMPSDQFHNIVVPHKGEYISFNKCAIELPPKYASSISKKAETLALYQSQMHAIVNSKVSDPSWRIDPGTLKSNTSADAQQSPFLQFSSTNVSPAIKKQFLEWLKSKGKLREVVDVIRIEASVAEEVKKNTSNIRTNKR